MIAGMDRFRVLTFNLRFDRSVRDETRPGDPDHWPDRIPLVQRLLTEQQPTILAVQEALPHMLPVVAAALGDGYLQLGRGRGKDGGGEASALYVDQARFDVERSGQLALSDTPDVPGSKSWGNTLPRIATWARLRDRTSDRRLFVVNTHFDHKSANSQRRSAEMLSLLVEDAELPAVLTGDFNVGPGSAPYRLLTGTSLRDTWQGPEQPTYHGYQQPPIGDRIDWILATEDLDVVDAGLVTGAVDRRFPSDHAAVRADLILT